MRQVNHTDPLKGFPYWNPAERIGARYSDSDKFTGTTFVPRNTGTQTVPDTIHGGGMRISSAVDTDASGGSWLSKSAAIAIVTGEPIRLFGRFRLSEDNKSGFVWGVFITGDTTPFAGITDGIYIRKAKNGKVLTAVIERDSVEVESTLLSEISENVWYTVAVEIWLEGTNKGKARFFLVNQATNAETDLTVEADNLPIASEAMLKLGGDYESGEAVTSYVDIAEEWCEQRVVA